MSSLVAALRYSAEAFVRRHPLLRWVRGNVGMLLTIAAIFSAIATYMIITGSDAPLGMKPKRVMNLLLVNVSILALLIGIIGLRIYRLWAALRAGSAGSKLQRRIVIMFSLVTIAPALVVSVFSALFFNIGIQAWFNDRVQRTVEQSQAVAVAYLAEHKDNIRADAIAMVADLNQLAHLAISNPQEFNDLVAAQTSLRALTESAVMQGNRIIGQGRLSFALSFERIPDELRDRAREGEVVIMTTEDDKVRAIVKVQSLPDTYLIVGRLIDSKVIDHMESAQGAVNEYQDLKDRLNRLQLTFSIVFVTLALLLLLCSIWYGMVFASRLTRPIRFLVQAAEQVRGGDFSARIIEAQSKDEFGTLSRAFNRMTEQLESQRSELIEANREIDERRRFIETVLSGVSAGVIALAGDKTISLHNRSSAAILEKVGQQVLVGQSVLHTLRGLEELLVQAEDMRGDVAEGTLTLNNRDLSLNLHVRVNVELVEGKIEGYIVTFDDITPLVAAQRNAAWADVARRVAHEIKNPLTPIQLSADRLKRKYLPFITEDAESFVRYTDTIVKHVGDIGRIIEEFVSFARMPTLRLTEEDVPAIVKKAIFSGQVACPDIEFTLDAPKEPLIMQCDERQITQVLTNLLKNAAEAIEDRQEREPQWKGRIHVTVVAEPVGGKPGIRLAIADNGDGFPQARMNQMLEPYITTRSKGTGLGLSIVKKIVEDHKGLMNMENNSGEPFSCGAKVTLYFLQHCGI
jgi:two-component system, NtrC family, nitrogen regulation sensor histidine kinase NtrY